ncbi:MAG: M3 family oligoendopeptidase [Anaerolineales bacterium]|nr:M3 family oligoendopeptidase [Anaerolineales bacterium]MDW8447605.1 M3 family oligoendopeptidase [Anaerolineales bacterium]
MAYQLSAWSLTDLFPSHDGPEMQDALARLEEETKRFEAQRSQLRADIQSATFLEMVRQLEQITHLISRIHAFAELWFSADTQNQAAQTFLGQVEQLAATLQNRTLFFSLWWKDLDEQNAARLMESAGEYRYWLEMMRKFKPHTLSEAEEKIINLKDVTGVQALRNLYDAITNRYVFTLEVEGEKKELTRGQLMVYARHSDPELRACAYQELYRIYGNDGPILGLMYQTLVRDWHNEQIELRRFRTPISARNLANDLPDGVVDTLLEVCRENSGLFRRFFRLKARWIGMDRLRRYDLYAPVPAARAEKSYPFQEAAEMVLQAFRQFSPRMAEQAQRVFDQNHLDSEVRKGKRDGAFCLAAVNDLTPYVLLNYQGKAEDVATLAHELGHAVHAMMAAHHPLFTFHSSLPLAETASTFGEMLLVDSLLAQETDDALRCELLFRQLDDAYATIGRQAYFALFERQAHQMVQEGAAVEDLCRAYFQNLSEQFGDAVEVSEEFRWEWVSIPHFYHFPFYVYAYSFGQLLVLSLYRQYRQQGEAFRPRYEGILAAGGSASPEAILSEAGLNIYDPAFWQGGFEVLAEMIARLEAIPLPS